MIQFIYVLVVFASIIALENVFPHMRMSDKKLKHDITNICFGVMNKGVGIFFVTFLITRSIAWASAQSFGVARLSILPSFVSLGAVIILFDMWMYWWHRANHELSFLWRFHRMHHTDRAMDATSAIRFHPGEIIISFLVRAVVVVVIGMEISHLALYESLMLAVIVFHHSNIRLPDVWDKRLRALIVTPNMHRVHHSDLMDETNSNYATIFSFWDRLFRSYKKRTDTRKIQYGLKQYRDKRWLSLWGMLITPLKIK